jgi:hypothetical protein
MQSEAPSIVRSWRVGPWTVTLTAPRAAVGGVVVAEVEWVPALPDRELTPREFVQYQGGLARATADVAEALGMQFATAEEMP